jgi:hypothetical protein
MKKTKNAIAIKSLKKKSKNGKYAMELTFGVRVGVEASNFDLHVARDGEVQY